MDDNNFDVDSQTGLGYNNKQDDEYAAIAGINQHEQVVNMDLQKPVHDTECTHETLVPDPGDTIGEAVYYGCANPKCGRGWYIKK